MFLCYGNDRRERHLLTILISKELLDIAVIVCFQ